LLASFSDLALLEGGGFAITYKLVNARSVFESWAVLSALDVLDTFTTVICYRNETCSLALALNINVLVHMNFG
jgi:hypothetical protein